MELKNQTPNFFILPILDLNIQKAIYPRNELKCLEYNGI